MAEPQQIMRGGGNHSGESHSGAAFVYWTLLFLLAYTAWAWAGVRPSFHAVGVIVAVMILAGLLVSQPGVRRAVVRDPVFVLGLAFLILLGLQWANAGRVQYYDVGYLRWMYMPPRWPGWPFAFAAEDARQMLAWFFPAWVVAVTLRSALLDQRRLRRLLMLLACNAGLLALFGLIQHFSGTNSIYWLRPLKGHFFASFAYGNHAPPFFVLTSALAAGLLYREMFDVRLTPADTPSATRLRHPGRVAILAPVLVLCLTGAFLGFSRAGVILATLLGIFIVGYGWLRGWRALTPAGRVNFLALTVVLVGFVFFAVAGLGASGIRKEFRPKMSAPDSPQTVWEKIDRELDRRPRFALAALAIWRDYPWFGVGGWGYKYLVAEKVSPEFWPALPKKGWANAHCDPLQFLAEFGVVGMGLLGGALAIMMCPIFRRECRRQALWIMGSAGLVLVVLFSLVDLPFRSPAILYTWIAVLAAMPRFCRYSYHAVVAGRSAWNAGFIVEATAPRDAKPERTCR